MRFITAMFPLFGTVASVARLDMSCSCNSLTPETNWVYNWELKKYTCKHKYQGYADYDTGSGQNNCLQAGTVDGCYRYKEDDIVDTSLKLFVHYASATCRKPDPYGRW
ncbi:hypothetical protein E4U59_002568 [Claviceps monticola]|nr:hypothetical protein E4U59_002568 [Claviceps monticola]